MSDLAPVTKRVDPAACCGCGACSAICPTQALIMKQNNEGFLEPTVTNELCTNCGTCTKVCPVLVDSERMSRKQPHIFAYAADSSAEGNKPALPIDQEIAELPITDDKSYSSSGGAFGALAEIVLARGGVVFGAAWREDFTVHHICATNKEEFNALRQSKYLESDQESCYSQVAAYLREKKQVLYSGTPCQVAGLRTYLVQVGLTPEQQELLTCIDLLCSGVPSPACFTRYLTEIAAGRKPTTVEMRHPKRMAHRVRITWSDGSVTEQANDPFDRAFLPHAFTLRSSCFACRWQKLPRQGDITLGDMWTARAHNLSERYQTKSSLVVVNSEAGEMLWREVFRQGGTSGHILDLGLDDGSYNKNLYQAPRTTSTAARDLFFSLYNKLGFLEAYNTVRMTQAVIKERTNNET